MGLSKIIVQNWKTPGPGTFDPDLWKKWLWDFTTDWACDSQFGKCRHSFFRLFFSSNQQESLWLWIKKQFPLILGDYQKLGLGSVLLVVFSPSLLSFVIVAIINFRITRPMCTTRSACALKPTYYMTRPTCNMRQKKENEMDFQLLHFYLNNCIRNLEAVTKYWRFFGILNA